ncbi:MAG: hypothetical protein ACYC3S_04935 [Chloroflexota bacterium]
MTRDTRWVGIAVALLLLGGCAQAPATPAATLVPPVAATPVQAPVRAPTATAPSAPSTTSVAPASATLTVVPAGVNPATAGATAPATAGALFLSVVSPADDVLEVPAGTRTVVVVGKTAPDAFVSVNGVVAGTDAAGAFQVTVPLDEDVTLLEIVASDASGKQVQTDRIVVQE